MNQVLKCDSPFFKAAAPKIDHPFALYLPSKSYIKNCKITTKKSHSCAKLENQSTQWLKVAEIFVSRFHVKISRSNFGDFFTIAQIQMLIFGVKIQICIDFENVVRFL